MRGSKERQNHKGLLYTMLPCIFAVTLPVTPRLPENSNSIILVECLETYMNHKNGTTDIWYFVNILQKSDKKNCTLTNKLGNLNKSWTENLTNLVYVKPKRILYTVHNSKSRKYCTLQNYSLNFRQFCGQFKSWTTSNWLSI